MPFLLDRLNKLNYAGQIQRQALAQLVAGRLQPGDRLPSVRGLARDLHISRTTAERIQDVLCETLFAEIRPRSGAYVALPEDQSWSDGRKRAQALYAFLKQTILEARRLDLDTSRLIQLIGAFEEGQRSGRPLTSVTFPVLTTRDAYECFAQCLDEAFPARLVHLPPTVRASEFPHGARYLLSGYYLRGRARNVAEAVGCKLLYVRYNVKLLDRAMSVPHGCCSQVLTRDADNAETTRAFLRSAYPEVSPNRYHVCPVDEWFATGGDGGVDGTIWPTVTAAPKLEGLVDPARVRLLHPMLADDFVDELRCLALLG